MQEKEFEKVCVNCLTLSGVGKTYLAAFGSRDYKHVLFVAHREEILNQAAASFKNVRQSDDYGFFNDKDEKRSGCHNSKNLLAKYSPV